VERRGQAGGELLDLLLDRFDTSALDEQGEIECGELARGLALDDVENERTEAVEDEGPVVGATDGERLPDSLAERDAGFDRRGGAVRVAERL
jgi:hypothetical protein